MIIDCNCLLSDKYTAEMLKKEMKEAGVDKALVSCAPHTRLDDQLLKAVRENPGVLYGLYNADPFDEKVTEKTEKAFLVGYAGIRLFPLDYGFFLDDTELLRPLLDLCRKYGRAVWVWCTADVFCCPVLIKRAAAEYPDVSFVLGFMGFNYESGSAVSLACEYANIYLDCSCAMFSNLNQSIARTEGTKVLFGSAAGYGSYMEIETAKVKHLQLTKDIANKVFYENAARVFGI